MLLVERFGRATLQLEVTAAEGQKGWGNLKEKREEILIEGKYKRQAG